MTIYEKLSAIQAELKVPKGQFNNFGGYNYRSCEDILEKAKPICKANKTVLILEDDIQQVGESVFVAGIATLKDLEGDGEVKVKAFAKHAETKKGMDDSQITGTASSYARKYALNGLFNLDDTKDADTPEFGKLTASNKPSNSTRLNFDDVQDTLNAIDDAKSLDDYGLELKKKFPMTAKQADAISKMFNRRREELKQNASD